VSSKISEHSLAELTDSRAGGFPHQEIYLLCCEILEQELWWIL